MKLKCCRKKRITQRFVNKCGLIHKCRQINNTEKSETSKRHLVEFKFYIVAIESSVFWFETVLFFSLYLNLKLTYPRKTNRNSLPLSKYL